MKKKPVEFSVERKGYLYIFTPRKQGGWEAIKGSGDGEDHLNTYYVDELGCTCPGGVHHGRCWHQDAIEDYEMPKPEGDQLEIWLKAFDIAKRNNEPGIIKMYEEIITKKFGKEALPV